MSLINLICPHCGGHFELDPDRPLQSFWVCPYCGNRSLMQKGNGLVRLRGIITGRAAQFESDQNLPFENQASMTAGSAPAAVLTESKSVAAVDLNERPFPSVESAGLPQPAVSDHPKAEASDESKRSEHKPIQAEHDDQFDYFRHLAEEAAENRDYPLFNAYSRKAVDCRPKDPRIYALRAELAEEADGFARSTWTSIGWFLLTPKRKQAIVAQHLYNFNTALKYSKMSQQQDLIIKIARHLVRHALDIFTEQAELRCQKRLLCKTFKGHFRRSDLKMSKTFHETLGLINSRTCPIGYERLLAAVREELQATPKKIARRFRRF